MVCVLHSDTHTYTQPGSGSCQEALRVAAPAHQPPMHMRYAQGSTAYCRYIQWGAHSKQGGTLHALTAKLT